MRSILLLGLTTLGLTALGLLASTAPAHAQETYPARGLRMVVPFPPGGPTDLLARTVGQSLSKSLGQPVTVENRPGADGAIAAQAVAGAAADGYTLLFAAGSMVAAPLMSRPPAFDWSGELAPVGRVGRLAFCVMVHPDVPATTLAELVTHARANPGKLNFATSTNSELMAAAQFMKAAGIEMNRVPYKGGAQAMPDLLAGRVHVNFGPVALAQAHAKDGRLKVLATLLPQRSPLLPEVPTVAEAGFPGVSVPTWQALFVPARTPREVVARLSTELAAALAQPELRAELERRAVFVDGSTAQQLASVVSEDQAAWARLIDDYRLGAQ